MVMGSKLSDFMREVEAEAEAEGPEAVAELSALQAHYRGIMDKQDFEKEFGRHIDDSAWDEMQKIRESITARKLEMSLSFAEGAPSDLDGAIRTIIVSAYNFGLNDGVSSVLNVLEAHGVKLVTPSMIEKAKDGG